MFENAIQDLNRFDGGPSAIIAGDLTIGNDVPVGAGAIVTRAIPSGSVVLGNPAHVIGTRGSFDLISYCGMEHDAARATAIATLRPSLDVE